ncbi:MAG: glycerol-3-phosphate dehydrogenase/oxidase [Chloroflexota bacterium]|nr:glycerol-3-phosphate dehydrogenase/oxidase [Chloroflexota bacterium]
MQSRSSILDSLNENPRVPVLIIGAGANGVGVLWDLAQQGVDVLLVERGDFCSGTSAASGRVVHGGIRYLENGEFRLVREALGERNRLLTNAPHCVVPLPVFMPAFSWTKGLIHAARQFFRLRSKPGDRGALVLKLGFSLYDAYSGKGALPAHRFVARAAALRERPSMTDAIKAAFVYYDAKLLYPERLCIELLEDAAAAHPAGRALNYVSVVDAFGDTVRLRDELTGDMIAVHPKVVVNATGAWIDLTNSALRQPTQLIGGTRGSHLVVDHPELHALCRDQMVFFVNEDARICIFYPLEQRVLIGTTDIPDDEPDRAIISDAEIDYLIAAVKHMFPQIVLDRSHIVYTFSGVRPLPRSDALTPGQVSRDHSSPRIPPGSGLAFPIYSLVGGKWTSFRAFAEQVTDKVLGEIGHVRLRSTARLAIGGGQRYPHDTAAQTAWIADVAQDTKLEHERVAVLFKRYGTNARRVATFCAQGEDTPLAHHPAYSIRELVYLATHERVEHLDDLLFRRTMIAMLGEITLPLLDEVVDIIAPALGWSEARGKQEVSRVVTLLIEKHRTHLNTTA